MTNPNDRDLSNSSDPSDEAEVGRTDEARRDALKKMAVYSAYSAPALLALMKQSKAAITSIPG